MTNHCARRIVIVVFSLLGLPSCAEDHHVDWSYAGESGPEHWGRLAPEFATCASGLKQSPIDIVNPTKVELPPIELQYGGRTTELVNNGHTIEASVEPGNGLVTEGKTWNLDQLHFHSPSEHRVGGESFPLEVHFVHRNDAGAHSVVGVLFRDGAADAGVGAIVSALPAQTRVGEAVKLSMPLSALAPAPGALMYYRYDGSLTTPPCKEGVNWYVVQAPRSVSAAQVAALTRVYGANARNTQPLNGRVVLQ